MDHFFWTGFYLLNDGQLQVGPYQGSLACMELKKGTGVCWAAVHTAEPVIVDDVHAFPGHIACDARSKSEITVPLKDLSGKIVAVLDIDSDIEANFDQVDAIHLKELIGLIYS
jgi:GAF domain-containing protein